VRCRSNRQRTTVGRDADGDGATLITSDDAFASAPDWAPGQRIVFATSATSDVPATANLATIDPDGTDRAEVTRDQAGTGFAIEPTWLPGGDQILFVTGDPTNGDQWLARIAPDGTGLDELSWRLKTATGNQQTHAHLRPTP